jgi:hypothetical protein
MSDESTLASGLPEYLADLHAENLRLRDEVAVLRESLYAADEGRRKFAGEDMLRAEVVRLEAEVAEYRSAINWGTTCLNCASLLEQNYRDYVRAEQAEAEAEELRQEITDMDRRAANS